MYLGVNVERLEAYASLNNRLSAIYSYMDTSRFGKQYFVFW